MLNIRLAPIPPLNYTKTRKHQKRGRVHTNTTTAIGPMPVMCYTGQPRARLRASITKYKSSFVHS